MQDTCLPNVQIPGYEVLRRIGGGGMGEVYLANQLSLKRSVAIKFLRPKSDSGMAGLALRFDREALLMAEVAHPNIAAVFDRGTVDGHPYLVMEYVDGGSLRQRLRPAAPMPLEEARPILRSISRALGTLHERGILHRDLKPENVLLDRRGHVKVSDFGVAVSTTDIGSVTEGGQFVGTIDYMAPEQRHRLGVDERADQFSMAVIAYELLTGYKPLGIFKKPSEHNPSLTRQVDASIRRGLQRDPDDRYPTVADFAEALDRALTHVRSRPRKWPRYLAAAVAITVVTGPIVWIQSTSSSRKIDSRVARALDASLDLNARQEDPPTDAAVPPLAIAPFPPDAAEQHQRRWADHLKVPVVETNFIGMQMVLIPPGEFMMGTSAEEIELLIQQGQIKQGDRRNPLEGFRNEAPRRRVRITNAFYLGTHEVTVWQFHRFVRSASYKTDAERDGQESTLPIQDPQEPVPTWRSPGIRSGFSYKVNHPAVQLSWNDAVAFCQWLNKKDDEEYRLPTEAEWEYACRAGSTARWCFGDDEAQLHHHAWFRGTARNNFRPVGLKFANHFGLYDMHGNVMEWCRDRFAADHYQNGAFLNPTGPISGKLHVIRSGSFNRYPLSVRSAVRNGLSPSTRTRSTGFRVVRTVRQASATPNPKVAGE